MPVRSLTITSLLLLIAAASCAAGTIDSGLYTTYGGKTTLSWIVCGTVGQGSGCYDSGQLGPFGQIGSIVESAKVIDIREGTVTRAVYVVDEAYGTSQNGVAVYVYQRIDTITGSYVHTQFTQKKTILLSSLIGGSQATVFLAANKGYLVVGTSNSNVPVEINKRTYAITPLTIISQVPTSITADNYGYVTVSSPGGFFVIGPDGSLQEDGGGSPFMINDLLGTQPF